MIDETVDKTLNKVSNILILYLNFREITVSHFLIMVILSITPLFDSIIGFIEKNMTVILLIKIEDLTMHRHRVKS